MKKFVDLGNQILIGLHIKIRTRPSLNAWGTSYDFVNVSVTPPLILVTGISFDLAPARLAFKATVNMFLHCFHQDVN
jgi:hypothetical protein